MEFEKEVEELSSMFYHSLREKEIRENIITSIQKDSKYTNLWTYYCDYLIEQRTTHMCNKDAIELVHMVCKIIEPPGMYPFRKSK